MNFKDKAIRDIRLWAWLAAVMPLSSLAGMFFVWRLAPVSWLDWAFIVGEVAMFTTAVVWWWWAMWTMLRLVRQWDQTKDNVMEVSKDIKEVKSVVVDLLSRDK